MASVCNPVTGTVLTCVVSRKTRRVPVLSCWRSCEGRSLKPFDVAKFSFGPALSLPVPTVTAAGWKPADLITRLTAAQSEPLLGQTIAIVNPGALRLSRLS
jgi:hypothetical protein